MRELLCHLTGDYVLQNHRMANAKTSSWLWATVHVFFYMLPFLLLTRSPAALTVMAGTHLLIDRFRLAGYWTRFWGVGCEGAIAVGIRSYRKETWRGDLLELNPSIGVLRSVDLADEQFPAPGPTPEALAIWLPIIVDNTFHLLINHLSLSYLA